MKKSTQKDSGHGTPGCLISILLLIGVLWLSTSVGGFCIVVVVAVLIIAIPSCMYKEAMESRSQSYADIDSMTGEQFEHYIAQRLREAGYSNVQLTPSSGDYGVDIVAIDRNGISCAIQCKRYAKNVGVKAVQEVYAGAIHYGCNRKIVITSSYFTANAIELARESGVELIDRNGLNSKLNM